jgi:ferredoxin
VDCIHPTSSEDDTDDIMLYIDPNECIDCGACEPACPVTAIYAEDDVPDNLKGYIEANSLWYSDKAGARAKVSQLHG